MISAQKTTGSRSSKRNSTEAVLVGDCRFGAPGGPAKGPVSGDAKRSKVSFSPRFNVGDVANSTVSTIFVPPQVQAHCFKAAQTAFTRSGCSGDAKGAAAPAT